MSGIFGLQVWNSLGQKRLDTSDKVPKFYDSVVIKNMQPTLAPVNVGNISLSSVPVTFGHYKYYWVIPYPKILLDGNWHAVLTRTPTFAGWYPKMGYCVTSISLNAGGFTIVTQIIGNIAQLNLAEGFAVDIYRLY